MEYKCRRCGDTKKVLGLGGIMTRCPGCAAKTGEVKSGSKESSKESSEESSEEKNGTDNSRKERDGKEKILKKSNSEKGCQKK